MTKDIEQTITVSSWKSKIFPIVILCISVCFIIIVILLCTNQQSSVKTISNQSMIASITSKLSSYEIGEFPAFQELSTHSLKRAYPKSSIAMNKFMRSVYRQAYDEEKRKKRQLNFPHSILSDDTDYIISLPNRFNHSNYYFEYNSSLENLTHIEFNLPIKRLTKLSTIDIISKKFNLLLQQPFYIHKHWLKINLTKYIQSFPQTFSIKTKQISLVSSGFLTLYFRRSSSHSIFRRDLSSFYDNSLITYPNDPSYCQVRPFRTSFSQLDWTSWIIEPTSYEMNICSGTCHTDSNIPSYFIVQNLLNQIHPKKIPTPCCGPKRFSPIILLYYNGSNLILKRYDDMRVVECGCW